jgi:endonuclease III
MMKVQASMALLQSIQALLAITTKTSAVATTANRIALALYDKTVKGTTISLKGFKAALAATGIGLIAVAAGLAYTNWEKLRELLGLPPNNTKAIAALEREIAVMEAAGKSAEQINEKRRTLIGLQAEELKGQEKENKLNEIKVLNAQEQLAALTDQANTTQKLNSVDEASLEILKQQAGFYGSVAKSVNDLSIEQAILTITSKASTNAVVNASKELFENYQKGIEEQIALAGSQAEIDQIKIDEAIRVNGLLNEIEKQRIANDIQSSNEWNDYWLKERATELQALQQGNFEQTQILENRRAAALSIAALALGDTETYRAKEAEINQQYNDLQANQDAIYAEKKKQLKAQERDTTINLAGQAFTGVLALTQAMMGTSEADARKAFNLNKAASIADATVNTFLAATQALRDPKLPTVAKAFAVGGIIANGLAQVRKIAATQFKASGGSAPNNSSLSGGSGAGASAAPPSIFANPQTTNLGTGELSAGQGQGSSPMRAYVVERDITQSTRRVRRLEEFATLGA